MIFIHDLDVSDTMREKESIMLGLPFQSIFAGQVKVGDREVEGRTLKWSVFHDFPAQKMYSVVQEWVFPFMKNLHGDKDSAYAKYMDDAIFKLPTPLLLSKVVDSLDDIFALMEQVKDVDIRGDVYEYLLSKIAQSGLNGQFRTPRHIIRMMVELMKPFAEDVICDPACGTSGFLVTAGEYLKEKHKEEIFYDKVKKDHYMNHMFHGYDMDRTMLRIGAMNMMTHGVENPFIEYRDSLSEQNSDADKYSLILANPPFKGSLDAEAVISMPPGVFKPYAGVSTGILIFTKTNHGGTDQVWFYDMQADGFSLDDKRSPIDENDIPDIIERFHNRDRETERARTEKSFFVPKQEITDNDYDLSINKYKKQGYVPVEYPPTGEILEQIFELERQIGEELRELKGMLEESGEV